MDRDRLAVEEDLAAVVPWMPATHLISVDLPAPLSPTSAITSPARTSKSTSVSAWTEPKLFETPRSSSNGVVVGAVVVMRVSSVTRVPPAGQAAPGSSGLLAYGCGAGLTQYFANSPTQTSLRFRNLSVKSRLKFDLVIDTTGMV